MPQGPTLSVSGSDGSGTFGSRTSGGIVVPTWIASVTIVHRRRSLDRRRIGRERGRRSVRIDGIDRGQGDDTDTLVAGKVQPGVRRARAAAGRSQSSTGTDACAGSMNAFQISAGNVPPCTRG